MRDGVLYEKSVVSLFEELALILEHHFLRFTHYVSRITHYTPRNNKIQPYSKTILRLEKNLIIVLKLTQQAFTPYKNIGTTLKRDFVRKSIANL